MQFSVENFIAPKDHKSEEENQGNCSAKSSNQMLCKMEEYHPNIEKFQFCLWIMPSWHLLKKDNK